MNAPVSRRGFLRAGGTLIIGFTLVGCSREPAPAPKTLATASGPFAPNAFVRIGADDRIAIVVGKAEMGQGVYTALPMILAEELDADWTRVSVEAAPVDPAFDHTQFGPLMVTGGSTSVSSSFTQLREAGARARALLVAAAAGYWGVEASSLRTEAGAVIAADGRRLRYGELVGEASTLPVPTTVTLKDPATFRIIGQPTLRLEGPSKVNGSARFGLDVRPDGLRYAMVARPPIFGASLKALDAEKAKAVPGVLEVKTVPSGVAVIATSTWAARQGRDALAIEWDPGPQAWLDSARQGREYAALAEQEGVTAASRGDLAAGLAAAKTVLRARYEVPYLAHATMEPLNATVHHQGDRATVWAGSQMQTTDRAAAAQALGIPAENVTFHTTLLGGGFGRRANPASDFVAEAAHVARGVGAPVQTVWTREDDTRGGWYRPRALHEFEAGLDANGTLRAWGHRVVAQSIFAGTPFEAFMRGGVDPSIVEGAAELPYAAEHFRCALTIAPAGVPVLWWRSVGHSHTAFATECFLDELAARAGKDPFEWRRELLAQHPRHRGVLELAAEKAGWGTALPEGRARGIAVHHSFGSYVAQVAEVSVEDGKPRVHRVVCAVDCGQVINPAHVAAQMESAIAYGLSAALHGEITFAQGRVVQSNFHDYPVLRYAEMPAVEVHTVASSEPPSGIGEPGLPPIAPAVANALFALTGKPVRRLPIRIA